MKSPRRPTYTTVKFAIALLLALALLAGLIILVSPIILHPASSILPSSILNQPVSIPAIGSVGDWLEQQLQMDYRQVIAAGAIGLLLLALIGYFVRRYLRNWLAGRQDGREAQERRTVQPEALAMAYRHRLVAQLSQLRVMDVANPFDLETSYVPLRVRERPCLHPEGNEAAIFPLSFSLRVGGAKGGGETMSPQEALIRFRHLALLGEPGAGKTTLLRYLAFRAAQGKLEDLPDFPIFISLGHFATAAPQASLLDLIIREIDALYGSPALRSYLEERLEEGSVLLLLDGLDEASVGSLGDRPEQASPPQTGGLKGTEVTYRHVVGQINVLTARYPQVPVVITSRRAGWKGLLAASFHILDVVKLEQDDIQRFVVNWLGQRPARAKGSDWASELRKTVLRNPQIWTLAANPLLLSLMALVFEQDGELPEGRARLYERGMELLLEKWETHRGRKRVSRFTAEHQRDLLKEVALHFHLRRLPCFPEDDLSGITASYLSSAGLPADWVPTVLERMIAQHGLLREQALKWYSFPHLTWQEYFAAAAISKGLVGDRLEQGQLELALEGIPDPWWEGTILFLAEMLEDATPLLKGILNREDDIFRSNLLLAGRCLARKPRVKRAGLRESIIEWLQELVEEEYYLPLRQWAIGVLAEVGGPSIAAYFMSLATAPKGTCSEPFDYTQDKACFAPVHRWVITALASLGDESAVPNLVALLSDQGVEPAVRANVAAALGSLSPCLGVVSQFLALLPDEGVDHRVRVAVAEALGSLVAWPEQKGGGWALGQSKGDWPEQGQRNESKFTVASQLLRLLPNEKVDYRVRMKAAEALGSLGAWPEHSSVRGWPERVESIISRLLRLLRNEKVDYNVRMAVAEALGSLGACSEQLGWRPARAGGKSIASQLLAILPKRRIDPDVRASVATALGTLGDKSVAPQLMRLLSNEKIDPSIRWRIVDSLGILGAMDSEATVPDLLGLLADEGIDSSVRVTMAEAMGERTVTPRLPTPMPVGREAAKALRSLGDRSKTSQLLALLPDRELDRSVRLKIVEALGALGDDRLTAEGLATLLGDEEIGSDVYQALFLVSQRIGVRVFAREGGEHEVR